MAVKKPAKKSPAKARKPDTMDANIYALLQVISSDIKDIADMVANLGPKEEPPVIEPEPLDAEEAP